jgi:hypothetical protein
MHEFIFEIVDCKGLLLANQVKFSGQSNEGLEIKQTIREFVANLV